MSGKPIPESWRTLTDEDAYSKPVHTTARCTGDLLKYGPFPNPWINRRNQIVRELWGLDPAYPNAMVKMERARARQVPYHMVVHPWPPGSDPEVS